MQTTKQVYQDERYAMLRTENNKLKVLDTYQELLQDYLSDEDKAFIYRQVGIIYFYDLNSLEEGEQAFIESLKYDKYDGYTLLNLAKIYEKKGNLYTSKVEEYYKKAATAQPIYKIDLAKYYIRTGKTAEAINVFNNSEVYQYNNFNMGLFLKGIAHFFAQNEPKAEKLIVKCGINHMSALCEIPKLELPIGKGAYLKEKTSMKTK
ncbi:MAG: hypothetical protein FWF57_04220 [Defluviitaleaceae bacterium]|nr:hypothetical protein [Defluviitaleaceae bacterium]